MEVLLQFGLVFLIICGAGLYKQYQKIKKRQNAPEVQNQKDDTFTQRMKHRVYSVKGVALQICIVLLVLLALMGVIWLVGSFAPDLFFDDAHRY